MAYFRDTRPRRRRDDVLAGMVILLGVVLLFVPDSVQGPIRGSLRRTVLRPFVATQAALAETPLRREDPAALQAERDSLAVLAAAQAPLAEENRRLRALLDLKPRLGESWVSASVLRLGVGPAESTFMVSAGRAEGVRVGSAVISSGGLLGVVENVDEHTAQAIDWTHPDFRASAMTADGNVYGLVEPRRGRFREEDELRLTGAPFHSDLRPGTRVVTSGRGGIYPRGIPVGAVVGIEDADTGWRKSYLLRPAVRPESAKEIFVNIAADAASADYSAAWYGPRTRDRLTAADSVGKR